MSQPRKPQWGRTIALALAAAGLIVYLAVTPTHVSQHRAVSVTVANETGHVLTTLSVTVGESLWEIGPLPPGGSIPFHFSPKTDAEYIITGAVDGGDDIRSAIPYTTDGQDDLVTFTETDVVVQRLH